MNLLSKTRALRDRLKREPVAAALVSLANDSAVYLAGGLLIGLGNVILVPLYTRTLTPREFGVYALVDVTVLLAATVSALKMDVSYLKWFADSDPLRQRELLGSTLLAGLTASALCGIVLSLTVASRIGDLWLRTSGRGYAWLLCPIVVLENAQALFLTDLRARRRSASYSFCAILRLVVMVIASYYLLVVRQAGLQGLFLGRLIGDAAGILFLLAVCLRSVLWRFVPSLLFPMLRFGLPLVWSIFAVMLQDASGRYFLSRYGTLEEVGLLGAAIKVGSVFLVLFGQPFGVAWGGMLFQIVKQRESQVIYSKIFGYVYVLALGMALVLTIFAPTLFRIFTAPAYYPAMALLPLVLLVRAMNVIEQPAATGIYLSGRTKIFAAIYTVALGLNLLLLYLLVPRYGAIGVGLAWLIGSACVPLLDLLFGQRLYRLSFSAKLTLFPLLLWVFVLFRPPRGFVGGLLSHLVTQVALGAVVVLGIAGLLIHDIRGLRRQLRDRGLGSPAWEVSSH
jgi:O-antigen/teichoic acid export membrane protein